jgi:hypothetical protein
MAHHQLEIFDSVLHYLIQDGLGFTTLQHMVKIVLHPVF